MASLICSKCPSANKGRDAEKCNSFSALPSKKKNIVTQKSQNMSVDG